MPQLGGFLDDEQIGAVATYLHSSFGIILISGYGDTAAEFVVEIQGWCAARLSAAFRARRLQLPHPRRVTSNKWRLYT